MADLGNIITSKVKIKILELFFSDVTEMYHVRGVVRLVNEEINAVRHNLNRFEKAGILKKEPRGNRVYYWPRKDHAFFGDILSMVAKTTGLGAQIVANKRKIGSLSFVMFSGRFTRKKKRKAEDEVDVLVVGEVVLPELASLIRVEESKRGHELNYTVMSREEFDFRRRRRDPFLQSILYGGRVMIIGDEQDLVS